jgi:hypothetical protein
VPSCFQWWSTDGATYLDWECKPQHTAACSMHPCCSFVVGDRGVGGYWLATRTGRRCFASLTFMHLCCSLSVGAVYLVERGNCSFVSKYQAVLAAGGSGMILFDDIPGALLWAALSYLWSLSHVNAVCTCCTAPSGGRLSCSQLWRSHTEQQQG